jgi:hypothetical protein
MRGCNDGARRSEQPLYFERTFLHLPPSQHKNVVHPGEARTLGSGGSAHRKRPCGTGQALTAGDDSAKNPFDISRLVEEASDDVCLRQSAQPSACERDADSARRLPAGDPESSDEGAFGGPSFKQASHPPDWPNEDDFYDKEERETDQWGFTRLEVLVVHEYDVANP